MRVLKKELNILFNSLRMKKKLKKNHLNYLKFLSIITFKAKISDFILVSAIMANPEGDGRFSLHFFKISGLLEDIITPLGYLAGRLERRGLDDTINYFVCSFSLPFLIEFFGILNPSV